MSSNVRKLVLAGLFVALDIIFARFLFLYLPPGTRLVRASPQFLAHALSGWLLGPFFSIGSAVAGDLLGMLVNNAGATIFPGYTVSAALTGLTYGVMLYRRPVRLWRCIVTVALVVLGISLMLTSYWNSIYFSMPWFESMMAALPWRLLTIPVYTALLYGVQKGLQRSKAVSFL